MRALVPVVALLLCASTSYAQQCLHGTDETAEQKSRSRAALRLMRQINTAQATTGMEKAKKFLPLEELGVDAASAPGFTPKLTTDGKSYSVLLKDSTDPCGFALLTSEEGVIYTAMPLR